jgi:tRNA threonylcarbamoyladenosine biosynthesis protein TsaE
MNEITFTLAEINIAAQWLINRGQGHNLWLFEGAMGAGKTTLIRALCEALGVTDTVQSPTFSIVNEYITAQKTIYHFDCYRLKNEIEALDIGIEEYLDSGNLCMIEWPKKIEGLLPLHTIQFNIETLENNQRRLWIVTP